MNWLLDILFFTMRRMVYKNAINRGKKIGLLYYLRALEIVRKSLALSLVLFFSLQLMIFGLIGSLVVGVWMAPIEQEIKGWILLGLFSAIFWIPFLLLLFLLSGRFWFRISGAKDMMAEINS